MGQASPDFFNVREYLAFPRFVVEERNGEPPGSTTIYADKTFYGFPTDLRASILTSKRTF